MLADGNASAVVLDFDRPVLENPNFDSGRMASHGLVDRVVDNLPHEMVQAVRVGRTNEHAGGLANWSEALQNLDALSVVVAGRLLGAATAGRLRRGRLSVGCAPREFLGQAFPPVRRSKRREKSSSL